MNLYRIAQQQNIEVLTFPIPENESVSVMLNDGTCYIGMDSSVRDGSVEERVHLAHELGHCSTGAFYNAYSPHDLRYKHERKADKWAINQLVPENELKHAIKTGITNLWELAELFEVTLPFMRKAVCYYKYGTFDTNEIA